MGDYMENGYTKSKVISSIFWKLMERGGTQGIQFIVQIVLARLLTPDKFGSIAIVMVFINLAQVFVQYGFNTALIQKKDADEVDFSSTFFFSLGVAGFFYIIMYIISPSIARFYNYANLAPILRVLSLTLFTGAFNSIQNAFVSRNLLFKKLFKSSLGAVVISGILGILAAYQGFGIWALVIQQLTNQVCITVIMWFTVKWRPKLIFSFTRIRKLFSFGSKLLASALLETMYRELRTLIVGKMYTPSTLAYYNRGQQFPSIIITNINGSIQNVMLPILSAHQEDKNRVKEIMRRAIVSSSFLIFPMMIGMAIVAEPLVKIVLTDKWLPAVPFLQIYCISYAMMPIHTANLQAISALGRSDIFLKLEIVKKIFGLAILGISLFFDVYIIAFGQLVSSIISTFINAYPNKELLDYSYKEQLQDIMPSFLLSMIMGAMVYIFKLIELSAPVTLIIQGCVGVFLYVGMAWIFKLEAFVYLISTISEFLVSKSRKALKNDNRDDFERL